MSIPKNNLRLKIKYHLYCTGNNKPSLKHLGSASYRLISEKFVIKKVETKSNYMLIVVRFSDDRKRKQ